MPNRFAGKIAMNCHSLDSSRVLRATLPLGTTLLERFGHSLLAKQILGGAFLLLAAFYLWKQSPGLILTGFTVTEVTVEYNDPLTTKAKWPFLMQ